MNFPNSISLALLLTFLVGCSTQTYQETASSSKPTPAPTLGDTVVEQSLTVAEEPKKNLVLPQKLAGIPFEEITIYEQQEPGQGIAYQYQSHDTSLDISVFDGGYSTIKEGIFSEGVHHFFEDAKSQIAAVEFQGYYNITEIIHDDFIEIGDQPFLYFNFKFDDGTAEKSSHLFLSAYDGNFLKIRLTVPEEMNDQVLALFIADFSQLISNKTTS